MNYTEQMRKLADDYYARRIARADYVLARRQILLNIDVALNGTNTNTNATSPGEDVTQPKFGNQGGADPLGEDITNRNDD